MAVYSVKIKAEEILTKFDALTFRASDSPVSLSTVNAYLDTSNLQTNDNSLKLPADSGAEANFLTVAFANKLRIPKQTVDIPIVGIGKTETNVSKIIVTTMLSRTKDYTVKLKFLHLPNITSISPSQRVPSKDLVIPSNIQLGDPDFGKPSEIDAIIGREIFCGLWHTGQIAQLNESLAVQNTRLDRALDGTSDDDKTSV
ncbi:hypothetical protein M0804_004939 [Polistes exclamans]|nr:hypothetical protein M0804_004939 [Polistes exclamans]